MQNHAYFHGWTTAITFATPIYSLAKKETAIEAVMLKKKHPSLYAFFPVTLYILISSARVYYSYADVKNCMHCSLIEEL